MSRDERNPDLRCDRRAPMCGHKMSEHANGKCFGVTKVNGIFGDCHCKRPIIPDDKARFARQGEAVTDFSQSGE